MDIDPRIAKYLTISDGGSRYSLDSVSWLDPQEARGLHHIYVEVLDTGKRVTGVPVTCFWGDKPDECATAPMEEKPNDLGGVNFPMDNTLGSYGIRVGEPGESDEVRGMGMGTPEDPGVKAHACFVLTYTLGREPEPLPEPEPDPEPELPPPDPPGIIAELPAVIERLGTITGLMREALDSTEKVKRMLQQLLAER